MTLSITKLTDNSEKILKNMRAKAAIGLASIGEECVGFAKETTPVDSGRLRNSIDKQVDESEMAVYIGTNVEYAPYVEFIDRYKHNVGSAHFLRDAVQNHMEYYKGILEAALKD